MAGNIYLIRNGRELLSMSEQSYDSEALLQDLLGRHPALLAGEQMTDGIPRRWLLIAREIPVSAEGGLAPWYLDHLYLDQDGIPTLVEVKRSTDTRIRREVVSQMLDYAANAVIRWSVDKLRARYDSEPDASERLQQFLNGVDPDEFWKLVGVNLAGGRIRMVFVADVIPPELRRIVDFLGSQLRNAEIFAVEVRNYQGAGERALVPRLVSAPKSTSTVATERQWNEQSFLSELTSRYPERAEVARNLIEWARRNMTDFWYGKGLKDGSCIPRILFPNSQLLLFALWTSGRIEMQFQHMMRVPPFDDENRRRELIEKLNRINGVTIPTEKNEVRPSFDMLALKAENERVEFTKIIEEAIEQVRAASRE
jgi:hypothetical protein